MNISQLPRHRFSIGQTIEYFIRNDFEGNTILKVIGKIIGITYGEHELLEQRGVLLGSGQLEKFETPSYQILVESVLNVTTGDLDNNLSLEYLTESELVTV